MIIVRLHAACLGAWGPCSLLVPKKTPPPPPPNLISPPRENAKPKAALSFADTPPLAAYRRYLRPLPPPRPALGYRGLTDFVSHFPLIFVCAFVVASPAQPKASLFRAHPGKMVADAHAPAVLQASSALQPHAASVHAIVNTTTSLNMRMVPHAHRVQTPLRCSWHRRGLACDVAPISGRDLGQQNDMLNRSEPQIEYLRKELVTHSQGGAAPGTAGVWSPLAAAAPEATTWMWRTPAQKGCPAHALVRDTQQKGGGGGGREACKEYSPKKTEKAKPHWGREGRDNVWAAFSSGKGNQATLPLYKRGDGDLAMPPRRPWVWLYSTNPRVENTTHPRLTSPAHLRGVPAARLKFGDRPSRNAHTHTPTTPTYHRPCSLATPTPFHIQVPAAVRRTMPPPLPPCQ